MEKNLMIAGFGGQGVMTMGKLLGEATCDATDKQVTFFPSYGAAMRGGTANCYVVISDDAIGSPTSNNVDDLIVMNEPSLVKFLGNLKSGGTLYVNSSIIDCDIPRDDIKVVKAPVTQMAIDMGNPRGLNVIMLGVYIGMTGAVDPEVIVKGIEHKFEKKPKLIPINLEAFQAGMDIAAAAK